MVATRNYLSQRNLLTSNKWVTVGHSQGGQLHALGAAQYASRAQLNYKGTVAVAPASNLGFILLQVNKPLPMQLWIKRSQCMHSLIHILL